LADFLAEIADVAGNVWPKAYLVEDGLKLAALMLRHPSFVPVATAQTAHFLPYFR
jgi:hypothetical protein